MEAPGAELRPQTGPGGMFRHSTSGPQPPLPASAERTRTEGPDDMDDHAGLEDLTRRSVQELLKVGHELDLEGEEGAEALPSQLRQVRDEFVQLRMHYQFGIDEVQTKVNILRQEFEQVHDYSPIEHRSEEHTSELQSRGHLVCRLLLEKKKQQDTGTH